MPQFETSLNALIFCALIGYMIGSIPFGLLITRFMRLGDLRKIGSGNIGATNVLRTGNRPAAALTLFLDGGKGAAAVMIAAFLYSSDAMQVAGFAAFIGHCFPIWLRLQGGKGVATFIGIWWALAWPVAAAICLTWLTVAAASRISSLAALLAAWSALAWLWFLGYGDMALLALLLSGLITWRHRENITRLRSGSEPRIGTAK